MAGVQSEAAHVQEPGAPAPALEPGDIPDSELFTAPEEDLPDMLSDDDDDQFLDTLASMSLVYSRDRGPLCRKHAEPTRMEIQVYEDTRVKDKLKEFCWRCPKCFVKLGVLADSFFRRSHVTVRDALSIIYYFARRTKPTAVVRQTGVSIRSVNIYYASIRTVLTSYVENYSRALGDSNAVSLYMEECGDCIRGRYFFAGLDSSIRRCFLVEILERDVAATLDRWVPGHRDKALSCCQPTKRQFMSQVLGREVADAPGEPWEFHRQLCNGYDYGGPPVSCLPEFLFRYCYGDFDWNYVETAMSTIVYAIAWAFPLS